MNEIQFGSSYGQIEVRIVFSRVIKAGMAGKGLRLGVGL
jgi:hypothetical protein